ncbi:30S ribosome-binding factor RbfA [bacterium]|nr:30S ribosome-binding factor RbfA [bacterium]
MLHSRNERIEEAIKESLSSLFLMEMKDPGLPSLLTITRVELSKDSRNATIYFSQLPDDDDAVEKTFEVIDRSKGFIRHHLAMDVNLRHTPEIHFRYDASARHYQKIDSVLRELKAKGELKDDPPAE